MRARAHPAFAILACLFALLLASFPGERVFAADAGGSSPARSAALFEKMVPVLMHPRCLNCHSRADFPRQGDDRHRHTCKTCHQTANQPASGVPGAPDWHLAPLRMAWEGLSAGELCRALRDPHRGGMPPEKLGAHLNTALVRWAWAPGTNAQGAPRSTPPLSHEALVEVARQWLASGSECPGT